MSLLAPAVEWAVQHGPPNWVFVVALLTRPAVWAKYVKKAVRHVYDNYTSDEGE